MDELEFIEDVSFIIFEEFNEGEYEEEEH